MSCMAADTSGSAFVGAGRSDARRYEIRVMPEYRGIRSETFIKDRNDSLI